MPVPAASGSPSRASAGETSAGELGPDILLQRLSSQSVRAVENPGHRAERKAGRGAERAAERGAERGAERAAEQSLELADSELSAYIAEREQARPRWVWDATTRWYPALLARGVRVERCADLRLCHAILRDSPFADPEGRVTPASPDHDRWNDLNPVSAHDGGLFALHEHSGFLDVRPEYDRQQAALAASPERNRLRLLLAAESSGALAAAEMTHAGLPWRADVHRDILTGLLGARPAPGQRPPALEKLLAEIRAAFAAPLLNPDSPGELLAALRTAELPVTDTRAWHLEGLEHPGIPPLLEYKKLQRLHQANGWRWIDTWVEDGRYHPDYLPGGVVTGRWAAQGGGALSLPGQLRPAVIADAGWQFVVADVAQLEPRILAAMSADTAMATAAQATDLYAGMVAAGTVATREQAKMGILGAMYGGTRGESGRMIPRLRTRYPRAIEFVERAARAGEHGEIVHTLLGRGSPAPTGRWVDDAQFQPGSAGSAGSAESRAWGRFTRNFVVQGTGAEWALSWLALLRNRLWSLPAGGRALADRPHLCFFLHDEVVVHTPAALAEPVAEAVRHSAAEAGRVLFGSFPVDFPLSVSIVGRYADAT